MKHLFTFAARGIVSLAAGLMLVGPAACTYKKANTDPAPAVTPGTGQNGGGQPTCSAPSAADVKYARDVWPILKKNCRDDCHNPQTAYLYFNFDMDVFAQVKYYSTTKPSPSLPYSYLVGNIRHEPGYVFMPLGTNAAKLSDCDIATIEAWVAANCPNN